MGATASSTNLKIEDGWVLNYDKIKKINKGDIVVQCFEQADGTYICPDPKSPTAIALYAATALSTITCNISEADYWNDVNWH